MKRHAHRQPPMLAQALGMSIVALAAGFAAGMMVATAAVIGMLP